MNIWKIRFANLNFDYDQYKVAQEINNLTVLEGHVPYKSRLVHQAKLPLFTEEQLNNLNWDAEVTEKNIQQSKGLWKSCSLTYLDTDNKDRSMYQHDPNFLHRDTNQYVRNNNTTNWTWREDINVPYIKQLVDSFNFKVLANVRVLSMDAGCIGLVHNDDVDGKFYKKLGFSITLNISSGGSPLVYTENGQRYDLNPGKCFAFRDDCWHGVPETTSRRIQLRINGIPDTKTIKNLLDMGSIIPVA
jgi:hypothetical protein